MPFPSLLEVRQNFPDRSIKDIPAEIARNLEAAAFASRVKPGARIAIGVGSRGIVNIAAIAGAVVRYWKAHGLRPFLFPAMGSHGAATAEGQAQVLAHYGIDESTMGCPVLSSLDVVSLGRTPEGIDAFMDRNAWESDAVMLLSRVKWHTDFAGKLESGLFKMMAIGLGKLAGAHRYHTFAYKIGMEPVVRSVARQVLRSGKMLGGLAIVEDANHNTALLEPVPAENMEAREEEILALAKSWAGRIPVDALDVLIVDEIGKDISGTGMDTKVVNRAITGVYNPWPNAPIIERVFVRDLTARTGGNAVGVGMADVVHERVAAKIDWTPSRVNAFTASAPTGIRLPAHFPTDRECLERVAQTVGKFDLRDVTFGWIRNTMELNRLLLSENLLPEIRRNPMLEVLGEACEFEFTPEGVLASPFENEPAHAL